MLEISIFCEISQSIAAFRSQQQSPQWRSSVNFSMNYLRDQRRTTMASEWSCNELLWECNITHIFLDTNFRSMSEMVFEFVIIIFLYSIPSSSRVLVHSHSCPQATTTQFFSLLNHRLFCPDSALTFLHCVLVVWCWMLSCSLRRHTVVEQFFAREHGLCVWSEEEKKSYYMTTTTTTLWSRCRSLVHNVEAICSRQFSLSHCLSFSRANNSNFLLFRISTWNQIIRAFHDTVVVVTLKRARTRFGERKRKFPTEQHPRMSWVSLSMDTRAILAREFEAAIHTRMREWRLVWL